SAEVAAWKQGADEAGRAATALTSDSNSGGTPRQQPGRVTTANGGIPHSNSRDECDKRTTMEKQSKATIPMK
ncbi:Uncharacterized protein APZ42_004646, partial [Daphnia magna]